MDTDSKLNLLAHIFPEFDKFALLDILISCEGSVGKAKKLLLGDAIIDQSEVIAKPDQKSPEKNIKPEILEKTDAPISKKRKTDEEIEKGGAFSRIAKFPRIDPLSTNKTITLHSKGEIEAALPNVKIFPNFLPKQLAEGVLETLMSQKMLFKAKQFYIAGNLCKSSQKTAVFSDDASTDYDPVYQNDETKPLRMTPELIKCRMYIDERVNSVLEELYKDDKGKAQYMIDQNWKSDYCVGNFFPDNKSHLDWHTDKLTNIGPLPTIASMSFGATRIFRLRRSNPTNSVIYNIPIPNNGLLIMLPSTQELYKHCVPTLKDSLVQRHPQVGDARFSLTFRMSYPSFRDCPIFCDKCKKQMILRRLFKGQDIGYYVWMCMGSFKGQNCKGFKYAKFDDFIGGTDFSTNDKNLATRWLSDSEKLRPKH